MYNGVWETLHKLTITMLVKEGKNILGGRDGQGRCYRRMMLNLDLE